MGLNEYSWFWISGAVAICGIALAVALSTPNNEEVEFAKAGLEECIKSRGNLNTIWVKDCASYLRYVEEGIYTNPKQKTSEISPF